MAKSTASFKLEKSVKRVMASIDDPHARGAYKRAMIEAQTANADSKNRKFTELRSKPDNVKKPV